MKLIILSFPLKLIQFKGLFIIYSDTNLLVNPANIFATRVATIFFIHSLFGRVKILTTVFSLQPPFLWWGAGLLFKKHQNLGSSDTQKRILESSRCWL